jgi:hypothetical protein
LVEGKTINQDEFFHKGQEAKIININPIFTIRIKGEHAIICGNIANEVSLQAG